MDWRTIRSFNGSQNNAFEELICQLARTYIQNECTSFFRVAAPDGGVESYAALPDGSEYGWQAKYFFSFGNSQWQQVQKSFLRAIETHPQLTKYFVCVPLDRSDPRTGTESLMDKWKSHSKKWQEMAAKQGKSIEIIFWGSFELIEMLSKEHNVGRAAFWLGKNEYSLDWFNSINQAAITNLGIRYSPEVNVEIEIRDKIHAVSRNKYFEDELYKLINTLTINTNDLLQYINRNFNDFDKNKIRMALEEIEAFLFTVKNKRELNIDAEILRKHIDIIQYELDTISSFFRKESKDNKNISSWSLHKCFESLEDLKTFIYEGFLNLACNPILILTGDAGSGKSHFLADVVKEKMKLGIPALLLLGQHFTSDDSPLRQIFNNLPHLPSNVEEFFGALSAFAEAKGERFLIVIDAINEGRGRFFWPDHLAGFVSCVKKYPWLGLVLSVRSSYANLLLSNLPLTEYNQLIHPGFEGVELEATKIFFNYYGIEEPVLPMLNPEFSNPLFLKLLCMGLRSSGCNRLPKGHIGLSKIFTFFIDGIESTLSRPDKFDYPKERRLIPKIISAFTNYKIANNKYLIPYDSAAKITLDIVNPYISKKNFVEAIIGEGLLSKNLIRSKDGSYDEYIDFAFERFDDMFLAEYIIENIITEENINTVFLANERLGEIIDKSRQNQGLIDALAIIIPEKYKVELYSLLEEERASEPGIVKSFIKSLQWRDGISINPESERYVKDKILSDNKLRNTFIDEIYICACVLQHHYNSEWLYEYLSKFSMADRDAWWTASISVEEYTTPVKERLIDWANSLDEKSLVSNGSSYLASLAISWILSTTNIELRNKCTYALTKIFSLSPDVILPIIEKFFVVDDPYILERILAAAYGALLRTSSLNSIQNVSQYLLDNFFSKDEIFPNILIRDYARNIIEYAVKLNCIALNDIGIVRPPYRSNFPSALPTNEETDSRKIKYEDNQPKHLYAINRILSSMVTEYVRGMYGDFGRYVFQSNVSGWKHKFDCSDLSNWACSLIFDKYGYNAGKHGIFDMESDKSNDRYTNRIERIGKKYQWISLYEVLARLGDNFQCIDVKDSWGKKTPPTVWLQGPWEPFVRNVDTSVGFIPKTPLPAPNYKYKNWNIKPLDEWLHSQNDVPSPENFLFFKSDSGEEWATLNALLNWEEPTPFGIKKYDIARKNIWVQLTSFIVDKKSLRKIKSFIDTKGIRAIDFPHIPGRYELLYREHYWSPAYTFFEHSYYGKTTSLNSGYPNQKKIGSAILTTQKYFWERNALGNSACSCLMPSKEIFDGLNLNFSNDFGVFMNESGEMICFDPSVSKSGPRTLVLKKSSLSSFLIENELCIFWHCVGEKNVLSNQQPEKPKWLKIEGHYFFNGKAVKGHCKMRPEQI